MAREFIVACDVDDVVADLVTEWLSIYNAEYNDTLDIESILTWDIGAYTKPECGDKFYDYLKRPNLYDRVKRVQRAGAGVDMLRGEGCRVVFVTSGNHANKPDWLRRHGFISSHSRSGSPDYVVAHDKSLIRADVLIDDNPDNLRHFNGRRILFDRPWNRNTDVSARRCCDWASVVIEVLSV